MSIRVLLADPDEALLASYRNFLTHEGFQVALATTGLDCVAQLRSFLPDILVLEPDLPWGWGEGVLAAMQEEADVPHIPVMVLSGRRDPLGTSPGALYPIDECQVKPMAPCLLASSLRRLVENTAPEGGFFG